MSIRTTNDGKARRVKTTVRLVDRMKHSRLSCSASGRWLQCPGSVRLQEQLPKTAYQSNPMAVLGSNAHHLHEVALKKKVDPTSLVGKSYATSDGKFTADEEMADAVALSTEYVVEQTPNAMINPSEILKSNRPLVFIEKFLSLSHLGIRGMDGGTADVVILQSDGSAEIIDYKHGQGVGVSPVDNTQMMMYAEAFRSRASFVGIEITKFTLTIIQPRCFSVPSLQHWELGAEDLAWWVDSDLIPKALMALDMKGEPVLAPSEAACRFCKVAGNCPALYERTKQVAIKEFSKLPNPNVLTADQKISVLENASVIRGFLTAVEDLVREEMIVGEEYDGFKLVERRTTRRFTAKAEKVLKKHLPDDTLYQTKLNALGRIEKALKTSIGKRDADKIMSSVTTKPEGALVVAPVSDSRWSKSTTSDFEKISAPVGISRPKRA